jgi:uncharacterized glyoxalase superfamily protein PhnB
MSTTTSPSSTSNAASFPELRTVTPHLVCNGAAEAIEFYKRAFNAVELVKMPMPDGKIIHACIRIGNSPIMLVDEFPDMGSFSPKSLKGTSVTIHLKVENADATVEQAAKAGATVIMPVAEMFWGDRYGVLEDPFGHRWSVAHTVRNVSPEEAMRAAASAMSVDGAQCPGAK